MEYFKISYLRDGEILEFITPSDSKVSAIKEFKNSPKGVLLKVEEVNEPFEIKVQRGIAYLKDRFFKKDIPTLSYIATLRQMAVMLDAGIPINETLKTVIKTCDNKVVQEIFQKIYRDIESGANLSDSFRRFEDKVGRLSVVMVELGEKIGMLSESINKLADFLQEIYDDRVKLKKATRYPLLVIIAMIISFSLVIVLVIPQFMDIFNDLHAKLPFPTRLLIWIENALKGYGLYMLFGSIIIFGILNKIYKKSDNFHRFIDRIMLKVYIVGSVIYLSMIGRFVYIFDRLTSSGLPVIEALKTSINVVDNRYLKERLQRISQNIEEGNSLTNGFKETGQFDSIVIQMIDAGENSGSLGKMLDKVSIYYKNRFQDLVDNVSTMIEPLLIAGIAGFVLLLGLGIFLPMWSLAGAMGG